MGSDEKQTVNPGGERQAEVYEYCWTRWAEYLNEHYKERFAEAGVAGYTFTELCADCPSGIGSITYTFSSDGSLRMIFPDAICEYDEYELGLRATVDPSYDAQKLLEEGKLRFTKNAGLFTKLIPLIPIMMEAYYEIIEEVEKKFNIKMPRYK